MFEELGELAKEMGGDEQAVQLTLQSMSSFGKSKSS